MRKRRAAKIGKRITELTKLAGTTLKILANDLGISEATMYAYSSGALPVPDKRIPELAKALGVKPEDLTNPLAPDLEDPALMGVALIEAHLSPPNPSEALRLALEYAESGKWGKDHTVEAEFGTRAGRALLLRGEFVRALSELERAKAVFESQQSLPGKAKCAQLCGFAYTSIGELESAEESFQEALNCFSPDEQWRAEVALAALHERCGRFERASDSLDRLAASCQTPLQSAYVLFNRASLAGAVGQWARCLELNYLALEIAGQLELPDQISERFLQLCQASLHCGEYEQASLYAMRGLDHCRSQGDLARKTFIGLILAQLLAVTGDFAAAREMALHNLEAAIRGQYRRSEALGLETLCEIFAAENKWSRAAEYAVQLRAFSEAHQFPISRLRAIATLLRYQVQVMGDVSSEFEAAALEAKLSDSLTEPRAQIEFALAERALAAGRTSEFDERLTKALSLSEEAGTKPLSYTLLKTRAEKLPPIDSAMKSRIGEQMANIRMGFEKQSIYFPDGTGMKKLPVSTDDSTSGATT